MDTEPDYLCIPFPDGDTATLPIPRELGAERVWNEIIPAVQDFTLHVAEACQHPKPCAQCRQEIVTGAGAFMRKAAGR